MSTGTFIVDQPCPTCNGPNVATCKEPSGVTATPTCPGCEAASRSKLARAADVETLDSGRVGALRRAGARRGQLPLVTLTGAALGFRPFERLLLGVLLAVHRGERLRGHFGLRDRRRPRRRGRAGEGVGERGDAEDVNGDDERDEPAGAPPRTLPPGARGHCQETEALLPPEQVMPDPACEHVIVYV